MRIPSGKTDQVIYFVAVDPTDLKTRETALSSFTVYRSRNGGAATAYTTPTVTELSAANMPGVYSLLIDEDTTIGASSDSEEYCVHITQASMAPVTRVIELYRYPVTSGTSITVANGCADSDIERLQGSVIATPTVAGVLEVDITHIAGAAVNTASAQLGVNVVNAAGTAWNSGAIGASTIAADAIGASELAADAIAEIADAVWDEATAGHVAAGSTGKALVDILEDTGTSGVLIATGAISSTTFAAGAIDAAAIAANAIGASELAQDAAREIADEVLDRDIAGGASGGTRNVRNALRTLRNKVSIATGTMTVTQEDDATPAWTAAVTTAAGNPIDSIDPT